MAENSVFNIIPSGTGSSGIGSSGTGSSGTGPSGTGPSGTGSSGTGSSGTAPSGTGPSGTGASGTGPSGTGSSRSLSGLRTRRASAVARAAFKLALVVLPLLIIALVSNEKAEAKQLAIHNSEAAIHNSQVTIHNSEAAIHNSQFTIHNSQFRNRDSQLRSRDSQFTIHNDRTAGSLPQTAITKARRAGIESGDKDADETDEPAPRKIAYITIDDGPSRAITPKILDVLKAEGVKATFFVLPHNGVNDIYRRIIDEGHEIGNHSYSHIYASLYNPGDLETFREDVIMARDYIWKNFGYRTTSYRFPGGPMGRSASVIEPRREILRALGYKDFSWHVDTGDSRSGQTDKSAAALTANVLRYTRGREQLIVLMHDTQSKGTTLAALPRIIAGLRAQGYTFDVLQNYYPPKIPHVIHTARTFTNMKE